MMEYCLRHFVKCLVVLIGRRLFVRSLSIVAVILSEDCGMPSEFQRDLGWQAIFDVFATAVADTSRIECKYFQYARIDLSA